jgi:alkaline phosphatase D
LKILLSGNGFFFILAIAFSLLSPNRIAAQVLTHGPIVGGVTDATANAFVRTSQNATVALQYSTDPNFNTFSVSESRSTDIDSDYTAIVPLTNLTAETTYYLRVLVNGAVQGAPPYPQFATFPAPGAFRTFSFVVLTDFSNVADLDRNVLTYQYAANFGPAFAFIGGDFDHRNPGSLAAKRQMFKELYDPTTRYMTGFVPLILKKMPIVHQWDDHDAGSNNVDRTYRGWALSQQAFQEYVPTYPLPGISPAGIWQKFSYGQMDGFVLDCRSQRDPENDPDDSNKSMLDGNNLGAAGQLQWLKDQLLASTARWKVIFTSVTTNLSTKYPDGWAGYQTEWNDLKNFINTNKIKGIVFISGDLHLGAIDNGLSSGFPEMCVAVPNSRRQAYDCATSGEGVWSEGDFQDPCDGFGVVTVMQNPDRLLLQAVDEYGVTRVAYTVSDQAPTPTPTPTPAPPVISRQPKSAKVPLGSTATFTVFVTGTPPISYQWRKNGIDIPGATGNLYVTPPVTKEDNGALFSAFVSNAAGSVLSRPATLTVTKAQ